MESKSLRNYFLITLAMTFWSSGFVFTKIVYKYTGPITTIFLRMLLSSSILLILFLCNKKRDKIERKDIKIFILMGFFEPFLYFIGEGYGLKYISTTYASVIVATIPIFSMLAAVLIYKEKVTKLNVFGVLISFIGIFVMIGLDNFKESGSIIGILLMFFAVLAAVSNSMLLVKLGNRYKSITIITFQNLVGALLFLPLFLILEIKSINLNILNAEFFLSIIYLSTCSSVISFVIYFSLIKKLGITKVSAFSNLIPVLTAIISFILLGTRTTATEILGIIIVITGLFFTQHIKKEITYKG